MRHNSPSQALALSFVLLLCLGLAACSYSWRGQEQSTATHSVLGDGSKTLKIREVEHSTLYQWLPYTVRSQVRDEINARKLAAWLDSGPADFELGIRIPRFNISAYGHSRDNNQLFTVSMHLELVVYDGHTNQQVWNSGLVTYSENYQSVNEERAVDEALRMILLRAVDSMQNTF